MRILIADDEPDILKVLKEVMVRNKYTVDTATDGEDAYNLAKDTDYDCIILDIMMPAMDGLQVVSKLRADGCNTPILLLTALDSLNDRVKGLDTGADDYLAKPFAISELEARVRALLRRSEAYSPEVITYGNLSLSCANYELSTQKHSVRLSNKEYQIIEYFMRNPQTVFSSEAIMNKFWSWDSTAEINVVWTYIGYIRRKLEELEADVVIKSIRGCGYQLEMKV